MIRFEMKNCNMILTDGAKTSALLSGKIDKYELQVKKSYLLIKLELKNKLNLLILVQERLLKNKWKQSKIMVKSK